MICTVTLNTAIDKVLLVERLIPGEHIKAEVRSVSAAGKGINVAGGLAALGRQAVCCGFAGQNQAEFFRESLEQNSIECALTPCAGDTRTNTTILDAASQETTHLREPGFKVESVELQNLKENLKKTFNSRKFFAAAFCGSLPEGVLESDLKQLISIAREKNRYIVLDGGGESLNLLESGMIDIIKPNLEELQAYLKDNVEIDRAPAAARELLEFVDVVLLTLGNKGAYLITNNKTIHAYCNVPPEKIKNTVGCGDAFLAGWLSGSVSNINMPAQLKEAVACAAASACCETTVGCDSKSVNLFREKVHLKQC